MLIGSEGSEGDTGAVLTFGSRPDRWGGFVVFHLEGHPRQCCWVKSVPGLVRLTNSKSVTGVPFVPVNKDSVFSS